MIRSKAAWLLVLTASIAGHSVASAESAAWVAAHSQSAVDRQQPPAWWTAVVPPEIEQNVQHKATRLAKRLELSDEQQTNATDQLIQQHYRRVWAWHQTVDAQLDAAWADWDRARSNLDGKQKDELQALVIMTERIDPIYASFTPQIQHFLGELHLLIGEDTTTELLDIITRSPGVERTWKAYVAMVPQMTDEEKAILKSRLETARVESLAAWSDKRIVKLFKKQKVRNEFSIDYFGYGYRKHYQAWVKRANGE